MPTIKVQLTKFETSIATVLAELRQGENDENEVTDRRIHQEKTSVEVHALGLCGELAFCKAMNLYPDLSSHSRDGGHDVVLIDGTTVDVKTTDDTNHNLMTPQWKNMGTKTPADVYVLVIGSGKDYTLIGYATKDMLFNEKTKCNPVGIPSHRVWKKDLIDMAHLY